MDQRRSDKLAYDAFVVRQGKPSQGIAEKKPALVGPAYRATRRVGA